MVYKYFKSAIILEDEEFDKIYPSPIRQQFCQKSSPIDVAIKASNFLVKSKNTRVLDLNSGIGKFCIAGSIVTEGVFFGLEENTELFTIANNSLKHYNIKNVHFINSTIHQINFTNYDSFYFFNPLNESISDNNSDLNFIKIQLEQLSLGTRIVTYQSNNKEIPLTFDLFNSDLDNNLKFWIKNHKYENLGLLEEQLIKNGITRLKNLGFSQVNNQTIFQDEVYKSLFENILRSQFGRGIDSDNIISNLILMLNKKV